MAGNFGVEWKPEIALSLDIGSLTQPGTNEFRGRRWWWTSGAATGAASHWTIAFTQPTVISRLWWTGTPANIEMTVTYNGPSDTLDACALRETVFREMYTETMNKEYAPMFTAFNANNASGTVRLRAFSAASISVAQLDDFVPGQLVGQTTGNTHQMQIGVAGIMTNFRFGLEGYLF